MWSELRGNPLSVSHYDELPADDPYASQVEAIANTYTNGSFEYYLEASGTTAFVVVHDDTLLYEKYFNGYARAPVERPPGEFWVPPQPPSEME